MRRKGKSKKTKRVIKPKKTRAVKITTKRKIKQPEKMYKCMRCKKTFNSMRGLKRHSAEHLRNLRAMKLLREGHVPEESKLGFTFKGKNKVVIS